MYPKITGSKHCAYFWLCPTTLKEKIFLSLFFKNYKFYIGFFYIRFLKEEIGGLREVSKKKKIILPDDYKVIVSQAKLTSQELSLSRRQLLGLEDGNGHLAY